MSPNLGDRLEVLRCGGEWSWGRGQRKGSEDFQVILAEGGSRLGPQMHMAGEEAVEFPMPSPVS